MTKSWFPFGAAFGCIRPNTGCHAVSDVFYSIAVGRTIRFRFVFLEKIYNLYTNRTDISRFVKNNIEQLLIR